MLNTAPGDILYLAVKSLGDEQSSESFINSNFLTHGKSTRSDII